MSSDSLVPETTVLAIASHVRFLLPHVWLIKVISKLTVLTGCLRVRPLSAV